MITLLLYLLRLLPVLFGGHRQLALENLALLPNLPSSPAVRQKNLQQDRQAPPGK